MKLIIEDDEGRKTVVPFVREEITIGRQEGNTIRLTERNVSRRHARLMRQNGHVVVEDLGSSNGTRINGERISGQSAVKDGDLIQIGDYDLALQSDAQEAVSTQRLRPSPSEEEEERDDADTGEPEAEAEADAGSEPTGEVAQPQGDQRRHSTAIIKMEQVEGNRSRKVVELEAEEAPRLVVTNTELKGQEYACIRTEMKIGRTDDNDIAIDHRSLSRTHAKIVREDNGEWRILDMQSANGLTVNGETYAQASLNHGDTIELGHVKLRFLAAGEALGAAGSGGRSKLVLVMALGVLVLVGGAAAYVLLAPGVGKPDPVKDPPQTAQQDPGAAQPDPGPEPQQDPAPEQPAPGAPEDTAKKLQERLQQAQKEFNEGNLDKAWGHLDPLKNPDGSWPPQAQALATELENELNARKALEAARAAYEQKKYDEALALLKPASGSKRLRAAHDQLQKDILAAQAQAQARPDPAKPQQPKPPPQPANNAQDEAKAALADATKLLKAKQYGEARAEALRCINLTPDNPECQLVMGVAYANENAWDKATPYYKRFLELAPDHKLAPKIRESLKQLGK